MHSSSILPPFLHLRKNQFSISGLDMAVETQFHVLAVDDSLVDRKLIEILLKTSSFQVTAVDSGNKALEFLGLQEEEQINQNPPVSPNHHLQEREVNLIITDYSMPGMTGYDLLRKIKETSYLKDIPVVIMSSENIPSRINRCLEEGAEDFFLKPVQLSDVNKLRPHLLRRKADGEEEEEEEEEKPRRNIRRRKRIEESLTQFLMEDLNNFISIEDIFGELNYEFSQKRWKFGS